MVAESFEADVRVEERVDAEFGVDALLVLGRLLSMQRRGLVGRAREDVFAEAAACCFCCWA